MGYKGLFVLPIIWMIACQDSGKTPFSDGTLFEGSGGASASGGGSGGTSGKGGTGGSSGSGGSSSCFAGIYDDCSANSDCCDYPADAICVNFGTQGTYCSPRCTYDSDCSSNCCLSTKQGNDVCHPSSACN